MKALITGASSGIGRDMAVKLSEMGYDVVLVARNKKGLEETSKLCKNNTQVYVGDISNAIECKKLFNTHKDIDILVNNAGFGNFGELHKTNINNDLLMIDTNIKGLHVLTKLYLDEMIKKDSGKILNVASMAAFMPGPLMSTYYASKSYVLRLTCAIYEELRRNKSNVSVSVLCPGPVDTNFNNVADVNFAVKSMKSKFVADYAIKKMFKNKLIIIPGFFNRLWIILSKFLSIKMLLKIDYNLQKKKEK